MHFIESIYFQPDKYQGNAPGMASNYIAVFSVFLCVLPQGTCVLGGITRSCLRT